MTCAIFPRSWRFSLGGVNVSVLVLVIAGIAGDGAAELLARTWLGR
jgi:hypothetical protein